MWKPCFASMWCWFMLVYVGLLRLITSFSLFKLHLF
jgi:hypothetical protein